MNDFKRILVPIDLSENCRAAIELASSLAIRHEGKLLFVFVAFPPLPEQAMYAKDDLDSVLERERMAFEQFKPTDPSVEYEHILERGYPGPDIVRVAKERECDLIVLTTHGRSGLSRVLMGSVAEYIIRNSVCPVLTLKTPEDNDSTGNEKQAVASPFVTSVMQHVKPIHPHDRMDAVTRELTAAKSTAAPVVDESGRCVGILTSTDIEYYGNLQRRFEEKDPSVIPEMFETDGYGLRRTNNETFVHVVRHMTQPVVTVSTNETCWDAKAKFKENPNIHHLIVVDAEQQPLGIVEPHQLDEMEQSGVSCSVPTDT